MSRWNCEEDAIEFGVELLPGKKQIALFEVRDGEPYPLAYFRNKDDADRVRALLFHFINNVPLPTTEAVS